MIMNNKLRLLVVCEEEQDFEIVKKILQDSDFSFREFYCKSFKTFTGGIHDHDPHLIILMGITESLPPEKISEYLKEYHIPIPVMLITSERQEDIAIGYMNTLIDDYVFTSQKRRIPVAIVSCANKKGANRSQEQALRFMMESEKKWTAVFNSEPECILVIKPDGTIAEVNPAGLGCFETTSDKKVLHKPLWQFVYPDDLKSVKKFHRQVARGNQASIQFRVIGLKGKISWMSANGTPLRDAEQRILSVLMIARDITGFISLQSEIKRNETNYRMLSENLPVGIFQADVSGNFQYVNPFWCKAAGISAEKAMGIGWEDAIHPDDKSYVVKEWHHVVRNQVPFHEEFRFLTPDGEINWISSTAICLKNDQDEITGYLGTITDINDNKLFEKALVESQARLEAAQELAKVGDWDFDLESFQGTWSKEMYPIYDRDPLLGPPNFDDFLSMIHPDDREKVIDFQKKVIENGHYVGEDYRILMKDNNIRQVYPTAYCMYDEAGKPVKLIGTLVDVTERVKSHESIRKNEQLIDTLFSQSIDGMFIVKLLEPMDWSHITNKEEAILNVYHKSRIVRANDRFLKIHGTTEDQTIGKMADEFSSTKKSSFNSKAWIELYDKGRVRLENQTVKADGSVLWIQGDYICIYDERGRVTGHIGFQKDITAEKNAMDEVRFSERNFREIFENSPDGIYIEDYNGVILNLNAEACRIQQLPKEKLIGKNIIDITPDPQKELIRTNFKKFCEGTIDRLDSYSWDKDWNPIPVEIKVSHIVYSGAPAILLHVRDMRIKRFTEQNYPAGLEGAMKSAEACLWDWNILTGEYRASGIENWLLGYEKNEIKPTLAAWLDLIHPDDLPMVMHRITEHLEKRLDVAESDFRFRKKSGDYIRVLCRGRISEWDSDGTPIRLTGVKLVSSGLAIVNVNA